MPDALIYISLFWNAFIAATLLPAFSEVALATLVEAGKGNIMLLFLSVTAGNVGGSVVNWWLGTEINRFQHKRWFPFSQKQMDKATHQFSKYGTWSLLLAWLPIIGDPLTLVAGILRVRFHIFLLLVTLGKGARYALVIAGIKLLSP